MNTLLALTLTCNFGFMGAPFTQIVFGVSADGTLDTSAVITPTGSPTSRKEPLTAVTAAPDEWIHAWISKDDANNALEMIVYPQGKAKLINPHTPIGKEMDGTCTGSGQPEF